MADFYMDTDAGSDASNGTTWALAKLTLEGLLAVMSAGDRGWIQGTADDTAAVSRTFTSPGTIGNPCILTGVVDGTSNEPPVLSDLAVTLPKIANTGGASDITIEGFAKWINLHLSVADKLIFSGSPSFYIVNGKLSLSDDTFDITGPDFFMSLDNCVLETLLSTGRLLQGSISMRGGSTLSTVAASIIDGGSSGRGVKDFSGVDFTSLGTTAFVSGSVGTDTITLRNCKTPAVFTLYATAPTKGTTMTVIASSDTSSQAAGSSIQDLQYEDAHGSIDADFTVIRTGGADDGASGAFSHAMTARADSTLESSGASLKSPWMPVWIVSGSQTLTVFIANSSASTDYNEDEVWVEFYTPDSADTAQHEQTFDPGNARLFASSTAITDDTGSTWGTGGNNHQKLSVAVTPGFEGPAYARLHLAKRQATPDTLYLDPLIVIT